MQLTRQGRRARLSGEGEAQNGNPRFFPVPEGENGSPESEMQDTGVHARMKAGD